VNGGKTRESYVVVRSTLARGKDGIIDALLEVLGMLEVFYEENETGAGPA
jgi:hypothetical protein